MENKFRNEMEISLGGQKILLRPSFENLAALESSAGGLLYLSWKASKALRKEGIGMSEMAFIIYHCQAAVNAEDPTKKFYSVEEIMEMVLKEGMTVLKPITVFLARCTAGNKTVDDVSDMSDTQKKS